ncbi:MAG TPA: helix-turn-helix domain-containing protein [Candidatus Acidoferrum sp.]|nr:helix-turn-helix domain-containing protein [Candidatus Acidoferrum sp.]
MLPVEVIHDPAAATVALDPIRSRVLSELSEPASAAMLSARLQIPRQKLGYHLRALESHGFVRIAEKRQWGGLTESLFVASASSYMVSPAAMGPVGADPDARGADRLSAGYLVALAARIVREVGDLLRRSAELDKRLPTLSVDTIIRFRSAAERAAFTQEFAAAVAALAARYHDESAPGGRPHRLIAVAYPLPQSSAQTKNKEH